MKVQLLPSALGSASSSQQFLSTYLINDAIAIDAGSLGFSASLARQRGIHHICLSHSHLDHIASLPILLENVYGQHANGVQVYGSTAVLECLKRDVFNDRLWPDFIGLSTRQQPFLALHTLVDAQPVDVGGVRVVPISVCHSVPTHGFLIDDGRAAIVIASDTSPTQAIWHLANQNPRLAAVFLEASFPNRMAKLAAVSGHLTPLEFAAELRKLRRAVRFIAVHIKCAYYQEIAAELAELPHDNIEIGVSGQEYVF